MIPTPRHDRTDRVHSLLLELAATFVRNEANPSPLITITRVDTSPDLKKATVYISVFPEAQEHDALHFLMRKGKEFRGFVKQKANLKHIPFFEFALDYGEKNRQHLDEIARDT